MKPHSDDLYPRPQRLTVQGFRSIETLDLELRPMNVLIGANGAGKSNLLGALRLLKEIANRGLGMHVGSLGGAARLLYQGPGRTERITLGVEFARNETIYAYQVVLARAVDDRLFVGEELASKGRARGELGAPISGAGAFESSLPPAGDYFSGTAETRVVGGLIGQIDCYHFHDTTGASPLRGSSLPSEDRFLHHDGRNLAAMIHRLQRGESEVDRASWRLIESLIQQVAPFIKRILPQPLAPTGQPPAPMRVRWLDQLGYEFDVSSLSDGTLRALALIVALGQPRACRPLLFGIDEPELGLHPRALAVVCSLLQSVSAHQTVIVATQNPSLLDYFLPEDVVVVDRDRSAGPSRFRRLSGDALADWLQDYSLSELLEKNVLETAL